jgi:hypothetical protein
MPDESALGRAEDVVSRYFQFDASRVHDIDDTHRQASGRIDGNFPGGTAELVWDFSTVGGRISRLEIAPP